MDDKYEDPYLVLDVSYRASEGEIKAAFQKKLKETQESKEVIAAYGAIRDAAARSKVEWGTVRYCFYTGSPQREYSKPDVDLLIKELAFCSAWELGDDTCLKI